MASMHRKLLLLATAAVLTLGQPTPLQAASCEDICGEKAAQNCEDIDSVKCAFYIMGCLAGCSVGKLIASER